MRIKTILLFLLLLLAGLAYYLLRPLSVIPDPATFTCLDIAEGSFISQDSLPQPTQIFGMGLTYRKHLIETAAEFDPKAIPPIFYKELVSISKDQAQVTLPGSRQMIQASEALEAGIADQIKEEFDEISPLLDYEVELGFVLLETVSSEQLADQDFIPRLGFFVANDLSARSVALLGEGTDLRYEFWGVSKSFPGFLPVTDQVWVPNSPQQDAIPCVRLETYVNDQLKQSQTTDNMIYTPREMLQFIYQKYPQANLQAGDWVLTGTPGGVAIATPKALVRLSNLLGFDRFRKLSLKQGGDTSGFLKAGDVVEVRGEGLGAVKTKIRE